MKFSEKVQLNKARNVSDVVDDTFLFLRQNFKPLMKSYFTICGFFLAAGIATFVINQLQLFSDSEGGSPFTSSFFLSFGFNYLTVTMTSLTILCFVALYKEKGNEPPTVQEVWSYARRYFWKVLGSAFLLQSGLAIGTLFCVIPGIYLLPVFLLVLPVMILEDTTLGYAFSRAFELIKNNWGQVFGSLVLLGIILVSVLLVLIIPVSLIAELTTLTGGGDSTNRIFNLIAGFLLQMLQLMYVLPVLASALVYYSLTEQKVGVSLLHRIEMLGRSQPGNDQQLSEEY